MKEIRSLYIHFPFCQHLCNYCDFFKHKLEGPKQIVDFEQKLKEQMDYHTKYLAKYGFKLGTLETIYIGGGTPSLWKSAPEYFRNELMLKKGGEFTIEVDPDSWTEDEIEKWLVLGVNRFSIGSQAYSDKFIKMMDRTHGKSHVEKTIKYFSERNLNFSVDLMLGLPSAQKRDIAREIDELLHYRPNHFSVYILKARANYPLKNKLPDDDFIRQEYLKTSKILRDAGYNHYEVSNFARDGFESQHNKKYWNHESVAAVGPNATGFISDVSKTVRYQWKSVGEGLIEEFLEGESLIIEKLLLGLRHKNNFDMTTLFSQSEELVTLDKLTLEWEKLGYLEHASSKEKINLTPLGFLMCDSLIDDIFKHLHF